ncbi:Arylsulfotransferase (ASST) [Halogranum amylolyticum]|uniref:Arylsulfotransferase (ASST) n=1 Tax=Halogranum amylolyticum TaxID=660520 RepID=A0A1H8SZ72_9EURY|nr:aryl-sulfate sulfotransferase [Halogranum amylolyticum]SEO83654.1 Arylsulfotransferase (ASST) [Halogranum amylolyticum]
MARTRVGQTVERATTVRRVFGRWPLHWQFVALTLLGNVVVVSLGLGVAAARAVVSDDPVSVTVAVLGWGAVLWVVSRPTGEPTPYDEWTVSRDDAPTVRLSVLVVVVLLVLPAATSALTAGSGQSVSESVPPSENITFYTVQGNEQGSATAGVFAIDTESKALVWKHTSYYTKYFDVDPIGEETILFTVKANASRFEDGYSWKAVVMNWRTGEVVESFLVPPDTHDVDYLGDGRYVVANKLQQRLQSSWRAVLRERGWAGQNRSVVGHQLYIYDVDADRIVWSYYFDEHFPLTAGDEIDNDYTHLNDVDSVRNGSAFLVSPREFDRVLLINRSTKDVVWTLGREDDYDVLHEQHNPVLLSEDPPTVLVADSENDRIVEYSKRADGWLKTWEYHGELAWPRDADRLPNGNTLVADSGGGRLVEVTPDGDVVWEHDVGFSVYDVERLRYGDEPTGPPMHALTDAGTAGERASAAGLGSQLSDRWREYYQLARWVMPQWVTTLDFLLLHVSVVVVLGWLRFEWRVRRA